MRLNFMHSQSETCNNFNRYPWPRFYIAIFLNLLSPYITSCHTFFSLTTIMGFVRIWENCSWIWFCEGFLCQFLAKKGEKGVLLETVLVAAATQNFDHKDLSQIQQKFKWREFLCDLWSELWTQLWPVFWVTREIFWSLLKGSLMPLKG